MPSLRPPGPPGVGKLRLQALPARTCTPAGRWMLDRTGGWGVGKEGVPSSNLLALPPGAYVTMSTRETRFEEVTTQALGLSRVCAIVR